MENIKYTLMQNLTLSMKDFYIMKISSNVASLVCVISILPLFTISLIRFHSASSSTKDGFLFFSSPSSHIQSVQAYDHISI